MKHALVAGASRGLGLEFVRQLLHRGDCVFAGCRHPEDSEGLQSLLARNSERLHPLRLDVEDESSIADAVATVLLKYERLDLLINSAGIYPRGETPQTVTAETMLRAFRVNAVAPLLVARKFLGLLREGNAPKIVNISSKMGSLWWKQQEGGGDYSYCSSKAALNMITRTLALDLLDDGIISVVVNPGWVQTDMGGEAADLTCAESVEGLLKVIGGLTLKQSGKFLTWDGTEHPW